ncbi:MAG: hypothetical protein WC619_03410 [Patescibacteria group bacterium]
MLEKKSILLIAIYSYLSSIIISLIFSPLFSFFYDKVLNPPKVGYGLFFGRNEELIIGGIIFSYLFFLPLFTFILAHKKQLLVWLIGASLPLTMALVGGSQHLLWFVIFTLAGGAIGWLIKLAMKKLKK